MQNTFLPNSLCSSHLSVTLQGDQYYKLVPKGATWPKVNLGMLLKIKVVNTIGEDFESLRAYCNASWIKILRPDWLSEATVLCSSVSYASVCLSTECKRNHRKCEGEGIACDGLAPIQEGSGSRMGEGGAAGVVTVSVVKFALL